MQVVLIEEYSDVFSNAISEWKSMGDFFTSSFLAVLEDCNEWKHTWRSLASPYKVILGQSYFMSITRRQRQVS